MNALLQAADLVRRANAGEPAALCQVYGHEEVMGWEWPDGTLATHRPDVIEITPDRPSLTSFRARTRAVTYCTRCPKVSR